MNREGVMVLVLATPLIFFVAKEQHRIITAFTEEGALNTLKVGPTAAGPEEPEIGVWSEVHTTPSLSNALFSVAAGVEGSLAAAETEEAQQPSVEGLQPWQPSRTPLLLHKQPKLQTNPAGVAPGPEAQAPPATAASSTPHRESVVSDGAILEVVADDEPITQDEAVAYQAVLTVLEDDQPIIAEEESNHYAAVLQPVQVDWLEPEGMEPHLPGE
jgi:hypothetical protein